MRIPKNHQHYLLGSTFIKKYKERKKNIKEKERVIKEQNDNARVTVSLSRHIPKWLLLIKIEQAKKNKKNRKETMNVNNILNSTYKSK